jgi:MFS family permease
MFWPTITALIQELTPTTAFVHANTFLMAGVQGGWLVAGAIVGFVYNHIGLVGVLMIDCATYVASFACYLFVRRGKHVVMPAESPPADGAATSAVARYFRDMRDTLGYLQTRPYIVLLGVSWALFISAMLTQGVITAPLSERVLHAGAVGYGWLNGSWGVGAFLSALYAPLAIRRFGSRAAVGYTMAFLALCLLVLPLSSSLVIAVMFYAFMGSARGVGGVAISSSMMEVVPKHFMGRVQNAFYFAGTSLQILLGLMVGFVARRSLAAGFAIVAGVYVLASATALWPARSTQPIAPAESPE